MAVFTYLSYTMDLTGVIPWTLIPRYLQGSDVAVFTYLSYTMAFDSRYLQGSDVAVSTHLSYITMDCDSCYLQG